MAANSTFLWMAVLWGCTTCLGVGFGVAYAQTTRPAVRLHTSPASSPSRHVRPRRKGTSTQPFRPQCPITPTLQKQYERAVLDASRPTSRKRVRSLLPVTTANRALRWRTLKGQPHLLVATWTNYPGYPSQGSSYTTSKYMIWVTAAPTLQRACRQIFQRHPCPLLRMKQVLGLPPSTRKRWIVEFWVRPQDLFRPCLDPRIDTRSCGLSAPAKIALRHRRWFIALRKISYGPPLAKGYPWTQLGYTYDWGHPTAPHVGLSEFVIKPHSRTFLHRKYTTHAYCQSTALSEPKKH